MPRQCFATTWYAAIVVLLYEIPLTQLKLGTITQEHAQTDIDQAKALG